MHSPVEPRDGNQISGSVRQPVAHDSGRKHVSGKAVYVDDISEPIGTLHVYVAMSEHAHARIRSMDTLHVRQTSGVAAVLTTDDIPGKNDVSAFAGDEPLFAEDVVEFAGQPLFAVVAESIEIARHAAGKAVVHYEELPAVTTIAQAKGAGIDVDPIQRMAKGDAAKAIAIAEHRLEGHLGIGGQEHFYLEGQVALALPMEDGDVHVYSSTQNPTETQQVVARILGKPQNAVTVEIRRMGGGFGGKETQSNLMAALSALAATKTGRAVKHRLDRDDDMILTGKRHDFEVDYEVGFDGQGRIDGIVMELASRCGYSKDLSAPINDRAMLHADNAYYLENATITSLRLKTNTVSNTAFRGFGGPQGMLAIEHVMDRIAHALNKDPLDVRRINFYGKAPRNVTPYHQTVEDFVADKLIDQLESTSEYRQRREAVRTYNANHQFLKKGIALTPVKFGISFTLTHLNQAGALIHVYSDGSIHLNHGGTEMGQGLFIKVAQVVANEFQVDIDRIKITATTTGKVPNTSPTAASSGSDLNGMAALAAARTIKTRLKRFLSKEFGCPLDQIRFRDSKIFVANKILSFEEAVKSAYLNRISLSSTGFYRTPKIHYDRKTHKGRPFFYYAYGAAVSEVIIDTLTGENKVLRTDILHETGRSLNPAMDLGQIEGGFIQGMGWLTTEELVFDEAGRLQTHAPSTYKIPACSDRPEIFNLELWGKGRNKEATIHRSKAVGEPPFMLANSVFSALYDAVSSVAGHRLVPRLDAPATPERILMAVRDIQARLEQLENSP